MRWEMVRIGGGGKSSFIEARRIVVIYAWTTFSWPILYNALPDLCSIVISKLATIHAFHPCPFMAPHLSRSEFFVSSLWVDSGLVTYFDNRMWWSWHCRILKPNLKTTSSFCVFPLGNYLPKKGQLPWGSHIMRKSKQARWKWHIEGERCLFHHFLLTLSHHHSPLLLLPPTLFPFLPKSQFLTQ